MGKTPKYIIQQLEDEKNIKIQTNLYGQKSIIKKLNKSNNSEILDLILSDHTYLNELKNIYRSNPSYSSWQKIYNKLTLRQGEISKYNINNDEYDLFFDHLKIILRISDQFLDFEQAVNGLEKIIKQKDNFLKSIQSWSPKTRNKEQIFRSLLRHLFTSYSTPTFLEKYFYIESETNIEKIRNGAIDLYIHMGAGKSLKTYQGYPVGMIVHKRSTHHLHTTPDDMDFLCAIRRIQTLYLGGSNYIFNALMRSPVLHELPPDIKTRKNITDNWEQSYEFDKFWLTVIKFFIDHPMIEPNKISEIIDYINNMKFVELRTFDRELNRFVITKPPHPNFSMNGRTPQSLLNLSNQWHYQRDRQSRKISKIGENFQWKGINVNDCEYKRGKGNKYVLIQLKSYNELKHEGNEMRHCVASYAHSCKNNQCAIFSLKHYIHESFFGTSATIEVRGNNVVQIRGKYNRKPDDTSISIIYEWAYQNNLTITKYAL